MQWVSKQSCYLLQAVLLRRARYQTLIVSSDHTVRHQTVIKLGYDFYRISHKSIT